MRGINESTLVQSYHPGHLLLTARINCEGRGFREQVQLSLIFYCGPCGRPGSGSGASPGHRQLLRTSLGVVLSLDKAIAGPCALVHSVAALPPLFTDSSQTSPPVCADILCLQRLPNTPTPLDFLYSFLFPLVFQVHIIVAYDKPVRATFISSER